MCHVGVVCAGQQTVAIATNNALDVAANMGSWISIESMTGWGIVNIPIIYVEEEALHICGVVVP